MKDRSAQIKKIIEESIEVKRSLLEGEIENVEKAAAAIVDSLKAGGKVLVFGNGGSAADSQHIAAELVGRFAKERSPLSAIALTTDTSSLTALANDYGYETIFSRQVEALGRKGDVAIGLSTSGKSENVLRAIRKAKELGIATIGLAGAGGGKLKEECDIAITVNSKSTPRIQESHITIGHIICQLVEESLFQ